MEQTKSLPNDPSDVPNAPSSGSAPWKPLPIPPDLSRRKIHVGTSGYYFDDWVGRFYPPKEHRGHRGGQGARAYSEGEGTRDKLLFYQKYFSFLEINQTFYKEPLRQTFLDIERRSKPGMLYAVKVHQNISHQTHFDAVRGGEMMRRHAEAVAPLVETGRFYSFLIQLEERMAKSHKALEYLMRVCAEAVRLRLSVHIEFRHRTWHHEYVLQTLKDCGVGICNTEIPPVAYAFPLKSYATTDKGYVRYGGLNLGKDRYDYPYSAVEMAERVAKQLVLLDKTEGAAIVFKNHSRAGSILNAMLNLRLLEERLMGGVDSSQYVG